MKKNSEMPVNSTGKKSDSVNVDNQNYNVGQLTTNLTEPTSINLQKLLSQHNMTQKDLADKIGISGAAINDYFNGKRLPNVAILLALKNLFNISIDDFLTKSINPDNYITTKQEPSEIDKAEYNTYQKYCGSYFTYYFDTSNYKGRDNNSPSQALRFGLLYIYENVGTLYKSTYSCIAVLGLDNCDTAAEIKDKIDNYEDASKVVDFIGNHYQKAMYHGDFELSQQHAFLSMTHNNKDKALAIFYRIESNKPRFTGGIGTINSVSKGREAMPTIQFMGISRKQISLSDEEIHHNLLLHYPSFQATDEAEQMVRLFKNLYLNPNPEDDGLTDLQKVITIKANLERYIRRSLERNMFRYGKISNRDDDEWYHLLKEVAKDDFSSTLR